MSLKLWGELTISDYLAVRATILEVSKKSFNTPTLDRLITKESIEQERKKAKKAGRRAESFDPHSLVFHLLNWVSVRKRVVMTAVASVGLISYFVLGVPENHIVTVISTISSPILLLGVSGLLLYVVWSLYIFSLRYNRGAIQNLNKHIRYSDEKIENETSAENVRAYCRWNNILCNSISLLCILILAFVRSIAPSMFSAGTERSKEWIPEYVEIKISDLLEEENKEGCKNSKDCD